MSDQTHLDLLYRFTIFSILAFFVVNLVMLLVTITSVYLILIANHVLLPLARVSGIF